jgi:hypothetical protein
VKAQHVLVVCLVAYFTAFAASAIASVAFYVRLKRNEHDVWLSLESPMPSFDYLSGMNWFGKTRRFLKEKRHRSLRDQRSSRLGDLVVLTDKAFLCVVFLACAIVGYIVAFVRP